MKETTMVENFLLEYDKESGYALAKLIDAEHMRSSLRMDTTPKTVIGRKVTITRRSRTRSPHIVRQST